MGNNYYRNKKILQSAKGQACQHCYSSDGSVVACHSNLMEDGKGVGLKSHDCFVAYLCWRCHYDYDQRAMSGNTLLFSQEDFHRAMKRTWKILINNGVLK